MRLNNRIQGHFQRSITRKARRLASRVDWVRTQVPGNHDDAITFILRLASVGVDLEAYRKTYEAHHEERYSLQTKSRNITSGPNSMYLTF